MFTNCQQVQSTAYHGASSSAKGKKMRSRKMDDDVAVKMQSEHYNYLY